MKRQFETENEVLRGFGGVIGIGLVALYGFFALVQPSAAAHDEFCQYIAQPWQTAVQGGYLTRAIPSDCDEPCVPVDAKRWQFSSTAAESDMAVRNPDYTTPEELEPRLYPTYALVQVTDPSSASAT